MSITYELREWAGDSLRAGMSLQTARDQVFAIADRIDAEHEREMQRMWDEAETFDLAAFEATHIELPKDADGVSIYVGDKLRFDNGIIVEVRYLKIDSEGTSVCVLATNGGGDFYAIIDKAHHYHSPTVEDVMVESATDWEYAQDGEDKTAVLKEYAKRLTLAAEEKE